MLVGMEADVLLVLSLRTTLDIVASTHVSSCVELSRTNGAGHPVSFYFFLERGNPSLELETHKNRYLMNEGASQLHTQVCIKINNDNRPEP